MALSWGSWRRFEEAQVKSKILQIALYSADRGLVALVVLLLWLLSLFDPPARQAPVQPIRIETPVAVLITKAD